MANEQRLSHHLEVKNQIKQLDQDKLLSNLQEKQMMADERIHKQEKDMEQAWKIYNEEQANKKLERTKKIQRNLRKLELKKEKVITKLQKHDAQVTERKQQKEQAIQLKRELNLRLAEERKEMQNRIKEIDRLENKQL